MRLRARLSGQSRGRRTLRQGLGQGSRQGLGYSIEYYETGDRNASAPSVRSSGADTLAQTMQFARDELITHGADFALIIDDETGDEVASVRPDHP